MIKSLKLSGMLSQTAPNKIFLAVVLGSVAGVGYALIIPLLLLSIRHSDFAQNVALVSDSYAAATEYKLFGFFDVTTPKLALTFTILLVVILICRAISEALIARVTVETSVRLRKTIYQRLLSLPIRSLDEIGAPRLINALNNDVSQVMGAAIVFPNLFVVFATLISLMAYLFYLNAQVFVFVLVMIFIGVLLYQLPISVGQMFMSKARNSFDNIQKSIHAIIYGAKELKLSQAKRSDFVANELFASEDYYQDQQKKAESFVIFGVTFGDLLNFITIGAITYLLAGAYYISGENLIGVIMVMLYLTTPLRSLINSVGPIMQGVVAARKLKTLLDEIPIESGSHSLIDLKKEPEKIPDFDELKLKDIRFSYNHGNRNTFTIGPIDLCLKRGEVTYFIGGNGSGKTTLSKIISLHYIADEGEIYFGDTLVTDKNRHASRESISAIYSDFYLFTKLFGIDHQSNASRIDQHLRDLELSENVHFKDGYFSSTKLSDGQNKRLALLVALLEERSVYVFDEWAADQDPAFKSIFYNKILPTLKEMNKIIIVITHDDRYFHLADRLVRMEAGKVLQEANQAEFEEVQTTL